MLRRVSLIAFRRVEGSRLILVDVYLLSNFFSLTHDTGYGNALYRANREYPPFPLACYGSCSSFRLVLYKALLCLTCYFLSNKDTRFATGEYHRGFAKAVKAQDFDSCIIGSNPISPAIWRAVPNSK